MSVKYHDLFPQHQVPGVGGGDDDALVSAQACLPADLEKALDLLVDATDRL
jgi:hypothetical protein